MVNTTSSEAFLVFYQPRLLSSRSNNLRCGISVRGPPVTLVPLSSACCRHWSSFVSWYTVTRTMSSAGDLAGRRPRPWRRRRRVNSFSVADVTTVWISGDVDSGMFSRNNTVCSPESPQPLPGAAVPRHITGLRIVIAKQSLKWQRKTTLHCILQYKYRQTSGQRIWQMAALQGRIFNRGQYNVTLTSLELSCRPAAVPLSPLLILLRK